MGWDAFATKGGKDLERDWHLGENDAKRPEILDKGLARAFRKAAKMATEKAGLHDWLLPIGGLDCSGAAEMLERVGIDAWGNNLSAAEVGAINEAADWGFLFHVNEGELGYYWSARMFLETCAKNNLGIRFSW